MVADYLTKVAAEPVEEVLLVIFQYVHLEDQQAILQLMLTEEAVPVLIQEVEVGVQKQVIIMG
jgi:hypothetical protein